jgi:hypothetical protein
VCHDKMSPHCQHGAPRHGGLAQPDFYCIRVRGCLDNSWSEWFDGLLVQADAACSETAICGIVTDQAALHGLLAKVRNLGLVLLEVTRQPRAATRP